MSALSGALQILFPDNELLNLVSALLFALFASSWAALDAKMRGIRILRVFQVLYFFLWPIGAVIYLLYRSGMRGLVTAVIHGFGLTLTLAATAYATLYGLHFAGLLDASYYR
jgi:hypothetical protein